MGQSHFLIPPKSVAPNSHHSLFFICQLDHLLLWVCRPLNNASYSFACFGHFSKLNYILAFFMQGAIRGVFRVYLATFAQFQDDWDLWIKRRKKKVFINQIKDCIGIDLFCVHTDSCVLSIHTQSFIHLDADFSPDCPERPIGLKSPWNSCCVIPA